MAGLDAVTTAAAAPVMRVDGLEELAQVLFINGNIMRGKHLAAPVDVGKYPLIFLQVFGKVLISRKDAAEMSWLPISV